MYKTFSNQIEGLIGTIFCYVGLSKRFSRNRLKRSKNLQSQNYQIYLEKFQIKDKVILGMHCHHVL